MARIAIASGFSCSLSWAARLQDEGHEVMLWNKEQPKYARIGEGIVPLGGFDKCYWWLKEGLLRKEPSLFFFDASGMADYTDKARRGGIPVVGGGQFCDKLEKDRAFGFKIAEDAGCELPPYEQYTSLTQSEAKHNGKECFFKADKYLSSDATKCLQDEEHMHEYFEQVRDEHGDNIKHIIQEKIDGVALSTARWWNGHDWTGPFEATYEHKAFMDGDVGGSTGCSFNAVFFYDKDPQKLADMLGWDNLAKLFRENDAPAGLYDMNVVVGKNGQVYFLEWTPRLGYDSELTSFRLFPDLGEHLFALAEGRDIPAPSSDLAYSIRLTVPPYPWEHGQLEDKGRCDGLRVRGVDGLWDGQFVACQVREDPKKGLCVAGIEGLVGVSFARGNNLGKMHEKALDYAKDLGKRGISGLQFRTDGAKCIAEDAKNVEKAGHVVCPATLMVE